MFSWNEYKSPSHKNAKRQQKKKEWKLTSLLYLLQTDNQLESKNVDVLLLGPQVRFMQNQFAEKLAPKGIPLDVINMLTMA